MHWSYVFLALTHWYELIYIVPADHRQGKKSLRNATFGMCLKLVSDWLYYKFIPQDHLEIELKIWGLQIEKGQGLLHVSDMLVIL